MKPLIVPRKSSESPTIERIAYSIAETARLLGCSERSLRTWIKAGKIHVLKIGARVFIPKMTLRKLLDTAVTSDKE